MPDATYDLTTDVGKIRLVIPDNQLAAGTIFTDAEILAFFALEGGIRSAAALALETIAADTAMTLKVVQRLDLRTDGNASAAPLLARAKALREQAAATDPWSGFEVAEMVLDDFTLAAYADSLFHRAGAGL